jgi:gliding motility-associated-like protein
MQRLKYVFIFLCLVPGISFGQLIVDDGVSASEAVNGVLSGGGVTIENIQHSGDGNQLGVFDSELSNIGLSAGIMLSTGSIHGAIGPNSTSSHTSSGGNTGASDPDLELLTGIEMNDASVLEFDFMPAGDSVVFKYVFASEEYNEYACSDFNDAFGFFLSGPGLNGPYTNGAINIARIPNTEIPVSINSINLGEVGVFGSAEFCDNLNPNWQNNIQYFVNNEPAADLNATQYDGLTTVLTATAYVNCGESYHIKIAIADAFDDLLDSAVFLEAGSLESQGYQTDVVITPTLESLPANTIIEGCSSALVTISRPDNTLEEMLTLTVSGSASNGLDYGEIPNIVTFAAGENSVSFPINAETDTYLESPEDVVVLFAYQNSCGNAVSESIEIQILDYQPLEIDLEEEVELCPESTSILNVEPAGGIGPFQYVWNGEPGGDNISISSEADWVQLEVMDVCGAFVEQIISIETSPVLEITLDDAGCIEQAYTPLISGGLQPVEIFWTGPSQPEFGESEITFLDVGIFEITWQDACGMLSNHEIEISSCALLLPNVFTPNSDSQNDYLRIGGIEHFPGTTVQVFDRWGSIIFGSHDYRNNWDAYGISDGTYFLSLTTTSGEQHSTHLTILR